MAIAAVKQAVNQPEKQKEKIRTYSFTGGQKWWFKGPPNCGGLFY